MKLRPLRWRRKRSTPEKEVIILPWAHVLCYQTSLRISCTFLSTNGDLTPPLGDSSSWGAAAFPPEEKALQWFPMHPFFLCLIDKEWASPVKYKVKLTTRLR